MHKGISIVKQNLLSGVLTNGACIYKHSLQGAAVSTKQTNFSRGIRFIGKYGSRREHMLMLFRGKSLKKVKM
jgi:hypothetical protein